MEHELIKGKDLIGLGLLKKEGVQPKDLYTSLWTALQSEVLKELDDGRNTEEGN